MVEADLTALLPSHVAVGTRVSDKRELERVLRELVEAGRAAWPAFAIPAAELVRHAAARLPAGADPLHALERIHAADLYLACACTLGHPAAYAAFEQRYMPAVSSYVAKIDRSAQFADEVRQALRAKLFVADGDAPPKIAHYSGRGTLSGWLRVASIRAAQNLVRYVKPHRPLDEVALQVKGLDPELDYLKSRYAVDLAEALQSALSELPPRERTVLALHFSDGLSASAIASLQGVHEATVRRWLDKTRRAVLDETRRALRRRLGASSTEVDSLVDLVQSRLDGTLREWLQSKAGAVR